MKSPQPRAELRVEPLDQRRWVWRYVEPEEGVELYGNETYGTAHEARESARRAYPDVAFADEVQGADDAQG